MNEAAQVADRIAKSDPTWLLALMLVGLLLLNGLAIRTIFNVLFRSPNKAANDVGGIAYEVKDALVSFVGSIDSRTAETRDSVKELAKKVDAISDHLPNICRAKAHE